jgi:hypothetical protein
MRRFLSASEGVTNKTHWELRLEPIEIGSGAHDYIWIGQTAGFLATVIIGFLAIRWICQKMEKRWVFRKRDSN